MTQAALPEPVAPPAAGRRGGVSAAAGREEVTSSSSASWGRLWAGRPRLRRSPAGRTLRSGPPERREFSLVCNSSSSYCVYLICFNS